MTEGADAGTWRRAPGVVTRKVAGEVVLVPVASGRQQRDTRFFVLNESAERLWSLLESPRSADELAQHLTTEFEVEASRARADVDAFLADLDAQGAVIRG
jgi:hypothetical protein